MGDSVKNFMGLSLIVDDEDFIYNFLRCVLITNVCTIYEYYTLIDISLHSYVTLLRSARFTK